MKKFLYTVSDQNGRKQGGLLGSASLESATQELQNKGYVVISLVEKKKKFLNFLGKSKISFEEKLLFASNLATMIGAGITITESFQILIDQTTNAKTKAIYEDLLRMVSAGQTLSDSLSVYPEVFSEIFINMVGVGEKSGTLVEVLGYLKEQLEKEYDLRRKVVSAFVYPGVIISITILMILGITIFIMPKILKIFNSFDVVLPLPTRILMGFTWLVTEKTLLFFGGVILISGIFYFLIKLKALRPFWNSAMLVLPVFGKIIIYMNLARFTRSLYCLLKAGVPINKGLDITSRMFKDSSYAKIISHARERVEQGASLEEALSGDEKLFPVIVMKMLTVGEKTGNLEQTTEHLANMYEQNLDSITKNLSVLLEPILLVFMGVLVGGVAIAVILPIYQLPNMIQK